MTIDATTLHNSLRDRMSIIEKEQISYETQMRERAPKTSFLQSEIEI